MSQSSTHGRLQQEQQEEISSWQGDLAELARDLVDKVGIEGAVRYCSSVGWAGVLAQVELLRQGR